MAPQMTNAISIPQLPPPPTIQRTATSTMATPPLPTPPPQVERRPAARGVDVINDAILPPQAPFQPPALMQPHELFVMDYDKSNGIPAVDGSTKRKGKSRTANP